jgi:murein DD-endopeptidase MepM/ murein hydrolase activator NlpD
MQKDNRNYTFLFTHSSRSRIYIKRIEISKRLVNGCASAALLLSLGAGTYGLANYSSQNGDLLAKANSIIEPFTRTAPIKAETTIQTETPKIEPEVQIATSLNLKNEPKPQDESQQMIADLKDEGLLDNSTTPNYTRPVSNEISNPTSNVGGPLSYSFKLTNLESETEEAAIEEQIKQFFQVSEPSFIPNMWAHVGKINNEFAFRRNPFGGRSYEFHPGLDIDGEKGDVVMSPANGTVLKAGWTGGYGNMLEIDHGNGITTRYGHLSKIEVQVGDTITRGEEVALIGSTGRSTGPHLHFEVRVNNTAVNPRRFLPPNPIEAAN